MTSTDSGSDKVNEQHTDAYDTESIHSWASDNELELDSNTTGQSRNKRELCSDDEDTESVHSWKSSGDDDDAHHRGKRSYHRGQHSSHHEIRQGSVKMPDGSTSNISIPEAGRWRCGMKSKLVTLKPNGRTGKQDYQLIESQMQKTKLNLLLCEFRAGCVKTFKIVKLRKVINGCLWDRYQDRKHQIEVEAGTANEQMLFHGTPNPWQIVGTGFDERYSNPKGVFGAGVYFTDKSSGANEYVFGMLNRFVGGNGCEKHHNKSCTECVRKMFLSRVALGKVYRLDGGGSFAHAPAGHHSVVGMGPTGYHEYVVYRGEQAYPEYVISYKIET